MTENHNINTTHLQLFFNKVAFHSVVANPFLYHSKFNLFCNTPSNGHEICMLPIYLSEYINYLKWYWHSHLISLFTSKLSLLTIIFPFASNTHTLFLLSVWGPSGILCITQPLALTVPTDPLSLTLNPTQTQTFKPNHWSGEDQTKYSISRKVLTLIVKHRLWQSVWSKYNNTHTNTHTCAHTRAHTVKYLLL